MKCIKCEEEMICYDDIVTYELRVDLVRCNKCNSEAVIHYGEHGKYINKVIWERAKNENNKTR